MEPSFLTRGAIVKILVSPMTMSEIETISRYTSGLSNPCI